jgi:hypothetical protein
VEKERRETQEQVHFMHNNPELKFASVYKGEQEKMARLPLSSYSLCAQPAKFSPGIGQSCALTAQSGQHPLLLRPHHEPHIKHERDFMFPPEDMHQPIQDFVTALNEGKVIYLITKPIRGIFKN